MAAAIAGMDGTRVKTVNGAELAISTMDGVKLTGSVHVVKTDIECSNGVILVIDANMMPPA